MALLGTKGDSGGRDLRTVQITPSSRQSGANGWTNREQFRLDRESAISKHEVENIGE
jgi:hypothetical protein